MDHLTSAPADQQLTDLAEQFAQWRQQRPSRFAPIPLPLWEQAIALTALLPLAAVAKRLGLRGYDLKKRGALQSGGSAMEPTPPTGGFVEVPTAWPQPAAPIEIELQRRDGTRLWIRAHGSQGSLAALVRTVMEAS